MSNPFDKSLSDTIRERPLPVPAEDYNSNNNFEMSNQFQMSDTNPLIEKLFSNQRSNISYNNTEVGNIQSILESINSQIQSIGFQIAKINDKLEKIENRIDKTQNTNGINEKQLKGENEKLKKENENLNIDKGILVDIVKKLSEKSEENCQLIMKEFCKNNIE